MVRFGHANWSILWSWRHGSIRMRRKRLNRSKIQNTGKFGIFFQGVDAIIYRNIFFIFFYRKIAVISKINTFIMQWYSLLPTKCYLKSQFPITNESSKYWMRPLAVLKQIRDRAVNQIRNSNGVIHSVDHSRISRDIQDWIQVHGNWICCLQPAN